MVFRVIFVLFIPRLSATVCVSFVPSVFDIRTYILCQLHATVLFCPQDASVSFIHTCFAALRVSYVPPSIYGR